MFPGFFWAAGGVCVAVSVPRGRIDPAGENLARAIDCSPRRKKDSPLSDERA